MNAIKLLLKEILYRKVHFGLSLLALSVAATLFVAGPTLIDGYSGETRARMAELEARTTAELQALQKQTEEELAQMEDQTRRLMRDMGFNLMIVHRDTDMSDFWSADFSTVDMPQEYVDRLAKSRSLTLVTHLVATLQRKIEWKEEKRMVLLVGYLPETTQTHLREKPPMGYDIEPGTVYLGYRLGIGRKVGETVEILGEKFRIARILQEQGSKEDITLALNLEDAQRLLDKPGKINQIFALGCRCTGERLPQIRKQLARALPETKITEFRSIALARAEQRDLVKEKREKTLAQMAAEHQKTLDGLARSRDGFQRRMEALVNIVTPLVIAACAIWVGLLALANVRERRVEIGLFRALGVGSLKVGAIFLGKAALLGLAGGAIGFAAGWGLAGLLGVRVLDVAPERFVLEATLVWSVLLGAPLLSAMASYLPTLIGIVQDPAVVLREE
jgi:hypothetical protein